MARGSGEADILEGFINASVKGRTGPCKFVRESTTEQRELITAKVEQGVHRWTAFSNYLASKGEKVPPSVISEHFTRGHSLDD